MARSQEIASEWREALQAAGLTPLERLLDLPSEELARGRALTPLTKPGLRGRARWRLQLASGPAPAALYIKRYERATWREQWDRIVRQTAWHSRAWWEHQQSRALAGLHIPAARSAGFIEEMHGQFEARSAVLLESVPGEAFDRDWMARLAAADPCTRGLARHDLITRLARFVAAFHGTGLCHRDLYLCHIFVEHPQPTGSAPRFHLIDLARTHRPRWRRMRWVLKDLSQLDASARRIGATRTDRYRFLLAYLGLQCGAARVRWYARRVTARSQRILRREARKNRPA